MSTYDPPINPLEDVEWQQRLDRSVSPEALRDLVEQTAPDNVIPLHCSLGQDEQTAEEELAETLMQWVDDLRGQKNEL